MKKYILAIIVALSCVICRAEVKNYTISSYCTINIPTTLVLRDTPGVNGAQYCFWPGASSDLYARILVSIKESNGLTEADFKNATQADCEELGSFYKSQMISQIKMTGQDPSKLKWYTPSKQNINGHYAIVLKYERPGLNGNVYCEDYMMVYKGVQMEFTLSYRVSEKGTWKTDFDAVMKSVIWK